MTASEDRRKDLLDYSVLPNDHLLQLALHNLPMLPKLLQHVAKISRLASGRHIKLLALSG
jgi:hypothetical protein